MSNVESKESEGYGFGTFSGVFTPSLLTIFGLIMFMRTSQVVGEAGVFYALVILFVAKSITLTTAFSMSAISTNTPVAGGGVYFLISRTLGSTFGGAIGVTLFFAQALSIPFYILGFTESIAKTFPNIFGEHIFLTNIITALILFVITWVGAKWAIKAQFIILIILIISIATFLIGAATSFSTDTLNANWEPVADADIFKMFALFFPAVTGIMAGVNMSGDLKDPQKSIPRGAIYAVLLTAVVYAGQMLITGGAFERGELINSPFQVLVRNAIFGAGFLVTAGVFCATVSSAIGSYLGAPRVLQALATDRIYKIFNPFSKGSGEQNEPRLALNFSLVITIAVICWAGRSLAGGGGINAVSTVVTMFFLYAYGMVNLAAFVESFGANPSFRPRFKFYHWSTALYGAIGCLVLSFLISYVASFVALIIFILLYFRARVRSLEQSYGDAKRGFVYSRVRNNLLKLVDMPVHPKNWRPIIAVLTSNPKSRLQLLYMAISLECRSGIVTLTQFLVGKFDELKSLRQQNLAKMREFIRTNDLPVMPEVVITENFDDGLRIFMQAHSLGPIKPNIIMQGWPNKLERYQPFVNHLRMILGLGINSIIHLNYNFTLEPKSTDNGFIDIWWRGERNGSLMLILAYLLQRNPGWKDLKIRVIRTVPEEEHTLVALQEMNELIESSRIEATAKVVVSGTFAQTFRELSHDSALLFLGFQLPEDSHEAAKYWFDTINQRLKGMPPALLVRAIGDADMKA